MKPLDIYGKIHNMAINFQVYRRCILGTVKPIKLFANGSRRLSSRRLSPRPPKYAEFPEKQGIFTTLIS